MLLPPYAWKWKHDDAHTRSTPSLIQWWIHLR
jgi:hypothetical protein